MTQAWQGRPIYGWMMMLLVVLVLAMSGCSAGPLGGSAPDPTPDPLREVNLEFCMADEPIDTDVVAACIAVPVSF